MDPVCGMKSTSDLFESDYRGKIYYFCSEHCKNQFDGNPSTYVK
ncbi:MAG: YHS domain-containing protein [Candidatus Campbellbacteria bacterium]|nr:YHS domain-containing protein [Candidatus Campbellbacteria bacterium]